MDGGSAAVVWRSHSVWCCYQQLMGCLHDPANVQQFTCILNMFAGRLLDRVNTLLSLAYWRTAVRVARSVAMHPKFNYLLVGLISITDCDRSTDWPCVCFLCVSFDLPPFLCPCLCLAVYLSNSVYAWWSDEHRRTLPGAHSFWALCICLRSPGHFSHWRLHSHNLWLSIKSLKLGAVVLYWARMLSTDWNI